MQAAEEIGVDLALVRARVGDTDTAGQSETSAGSRTTMATGVAAVEAARDLIGQMRERVARLWEVEQDDVLYSEGTFSSKNGGESMTIGELAKELGRTGGAVRGKGDVNVHKWGGSFAAHIADVEVDVETGKIRVLRYTAVQDVGRAIHPGQVEGQLRGGVTQGIGWALYEGYSYDEEGHMLNPHYLDYKMPTMLDIPPIETVLVENPWPDHPFGVRGVGEAPIVPPPATIANAIYSAVGVRPDRLPMTPSVILECMKVL
jgi:CO/xanthine dehydrogenase Mo-binding subunit